MSIQPYEEHRLQRAAPSEPGTPATAGSAPPAWLPRFRQDMQRLLLAELDLRLQPAQGLVDALGEAA